MLSLLANFFFRMIERKRQRAALHRLLQMNDRMLDDIGMRRSEIEDVLSHPADDCGSLVREARRRSQFVLALDRCV